MTRVQDPNDAAESLVTLEVIGRVALVTLNRPGHRNALSPTLLEVLWQRMGEADRQGETDVIVLTGADPAFCAGIDLKALAATGTIRQPKDGPPWPELAKPLVGAVNGPAVTGGLELALACDFLIASERARFADTHTRVGIVPYWGLTARLPQAVGLRRAREMSLTGMFLDAEMALEWGLVNRVVTHDTLLTTALDVATEIAAADQAATREVLALYRSYSGGGPAAEEEELVVAERFLGAHGIDGEVIEARRLALLERSKRLRDVPPTT